MTPILIILLILLIERVIVVCEVINKCNRLEINSDVFLPSVVLFGTIGYLRSVFILKLVRRWRKGDRDIFIQPKEDKLPDQKGCNTGCLIADISETTIKVKHIGKLYDHSLSSRKTDDCKIRTPYNYEAFLEAYTKQVEEVKKKYSPKEIISRFLYLEPNKQRAIVAVIGIWAILLSPFIIDKYEILQGLWEVEAGTLGCGKYYTINSYTYYNSHKYDNWYVYNKDTGKWEYERELTLEMEAIRDGLKKPIAWESVSKTPPPEVTQLKNGK